MQLVLGEYEAIFILNSELQTFCKIIPFTLFDHLTFGGRSIGISSRTVL